MKPMLTRICISLASARRQVRFAATLSFFAAVLLGSAGVLAAVTEKPSMALSVSPEKVWPGESALLRVQIKNADTDTPPDMDYLGQEFDILYQGQEPISHSLQITINGKTTFSEEKGSVFFYRLTPKQAGTIQIEPPLVKSDGVPIEAEPVFLRVVQPPEQDLPAEERTVRLELSVSPETIYPHTLFSVTLSVFLKESSGEKNPPNPLNRTAGPIPLHLSFGWGLDDRLPPEISPNEDVGTWLAPLASSRGGFSVNGICQRSVFSLFDDRETLLTFLPAGKLVEQTTPSGETVRYWRYDFTRRLRAAQPGEYNLQNAVLKGNMGGKDLYAASAALTISVCDIPQPRPEGYLGAVGSTETFQAGAQLSADTAEVGQALTLEVTLQGVSGDADLRMPDLESYEPLKSRFKIYAPNRQQLTGGIRWRWNLRPIKPAEEPFPAIPLVFFDSGAGEFKTFQTQELPLTVKAGSADLESFAGELPAAAEGAPVHGIRGNRPVGRLVKPHTIRQISIFAGTLYALLLVLAGTKYTYQNAAKRQRTQEGLFRAGEKLLKRALADPEAELHQSVTAAFFAPLAAKLKTPVKAAARKELDELLHEIKGNGSDPEKTDVTDRLSRLLDRLEEGKYSGAAAAMTETEILELYRSWESVLRRTGRAAGKGTGRRNAKNLKLMAGFLLTASLFSFGCRPERGVLEQLDRAEAVFREAGDSDKPSGEKEQLYRQAAALYEGLLAEGKENGAILYNLGNAYYCAGDTPRALSAWRRAERYLPADRALKENIALIHPGAPEKKSFFETIFFWRNFLSCTAQERLFIALTALFFVFAALRILIPGRRAKWFARLALTMLILSLPVYAALLYGERAGKARVILTEDAPLRKGDSPQYETIAQLPRAAECEQLEKRGGWIRVRTHTEQTGWVEAEKVLTPSS